MGYIFLKELAKTRLQEAKIPYDQGLYDGCCYLAGSAGHSRGSPTTGRLCLMGKTLPWKTCHACGISSAAEII